MILWVLAAGPVAAQSVEEIDRIIAIVNDDVIVMSELDRRIDQVASNWPTPVIKPALPDPAKQVLERLVMDRLQLQVAEQTGIFVSEERLNTTVSDMAKRNNLSLREFRDAIRQGRLRLCLVPEQIREQLVISQVRQQNVLNRVVVSERDVEDVQSMQASSAPKISSTG